MDVPDRVRGMRLAHHRDLVGFEHGSTLRHHGISDDGERVVLRVVNRFLAGDVDRPVMLRDYFGGKFLFFGWRGGDVRGALASNATHPNAIQSDLNAGFREETASALASQKILVNFADKIHGTGH